ncbi:MAG: hypothetical protein QXV69_06845 [Sulfolobaceae archaeon]
MRSFFGPVILQGSAIFDITKDLNEAKFLYSLAKRLYSNFDVLLLDLSKIDDRITAVNIDPDVATIKEGYVIAIISE